MKNHSRTHGNKGVGYRTPSPFRANVQRRVQDQRTKNGTEFRPGYRQK